MDATAAVAQAKGLLRSARTHKREEAWHRRRAKEDMKNLRTLESHCRKLDIELIFEDVPDASPDLPHTQSTQRPNGGQSDDTQAARSARAG